MARGKTRNRRLTGVVIIWSFLKNTCKHLIFVLSSNKKIVNGHCSAGKWWCFEIFGSLFPADWLFALLVSYSVYHSWLISVGCILWPCTSFLTKRMLIAKVSLSLWLLMPPFAYRTARPVKVFLIKTEYFQYMVNNKLKLSQWWQDWTVTQLVTGMV